MHDLRTFTHDRHRTVDDRPFGGGEGMVLKPEPLAEALASLGLVAEKRSARSRAQVTAGLSKNAEPQGRASFCFPRRAGRLRRRWRGSWPRLDRVVLICGRYEGVDERINQLYCDMELSIGDYVLSGGELAAAVVVDAVMRLIPGVLGNEASGEFESFGVADAEIASDQKASRARSTAQAGCSIIRTTRGRPSLAACARRRCC